MSKVETTVITFSMLWSDEILWC